jgi:hypothetical protein
MAIFYGHFPQTASPETRRIVVSATPSAIVHQHETLTTLMAVLGVTQFFLGAYGVLSEGEPYSIVLLAFGVLFVAIALWQFQESRIDALHERIRLLESGRR